MAKLTDEFLGRVLSARHRVNELETFARLDERGDLLLATELHGLALRLLHDAQRLEAIAAWANGREPLFPE